MGPEDLTPPNVPPESSPGPEDLDGTIAVAFQLVAERAVSLGLTDWAQQIQAALESWQGAVGRGGTHPVRLAIDATLLECASGPGATLLNAWVRLAASLDLDGVYLLPPDGHEAALLLALLPEPARRRTLAIDLTRLQTSGDELPRWAIASSYVADWPSWPLADLRSTEAGVRAALADLEELLGLLRETRADATTLERYVRMLPKLQELLTPVGIAVRPAGGGGRRRRRGRAKTDETTGSSAEPSSETSGKKKKKAYLDMATVANFVKSVVEVLSDVRRVIE